jgi:predicted NBD/HSP70 family sugar kinase
VRLRASWLLGSFCIFSSRYRLLRRIEARRAATDYHGAVEPRRDNDAAAIEALSRQASYLGRGLGIITSALSPEVILLTGGLTSSWARFGPLVETELAEQMLAGYPPRIAVTNNVELARLRGAAALVLQHHSGHNSSRPATPKRRSIRKRRA